MDQNSLRADEAECSSKPNEKETGENAKKEPAETNDTEDKTSKPTRKH